MHPTVQDMNDLTPLLGRTLVLVAHADDETVGCGALLQRMSAPAVIFATNGAPRDRYFWGEHGSPGAYARRREEEARAALGLAGVQGVHFLSSAAEGGDIVDQELHRRLPQALESARRIAQQHRAQAILTLAYEGGHPDHDACSFLGALLGEELDIPVWEMPLYHRSGGALVLLRFLDGREAAVLTPTSAELEVKRRMVEAYASQRAVLADFPLQAERFRRQPSYDYLKPSHEGELNYEAWRWAVNGADVCAAFAACLQSRPSRARRQSA